MKKTFHYILFLVLAFSCSALAEQSYLDTLAEDMNTEITSIFKNKIKPAEGKKPSTALYRFRDTTGKFQTDPPIIRKLLYGRIVMDDLLDAVNLDGFDSKFDETFPQRTLDSLNQQELIKLSRAAGVEYIIAAKIITQDDKPVLQAFIYNAEKGILLFAPVFPFNKKPPPTPDKKTPPPAPDKEKKPESEDTAPLQNFSSASDKPVFFTGAALKSPAMDFTLVNLDSEPTPEAVFVNTDSVKILKLNGTKTSELWSNQYKKTFPLRGLAGNISAKSSAGKPFLFVSMNVFSGAIAYQWEKDELVKMRNLDHFVVSLDQQSGAVIMSDYVKNGIAFSGAATFLMESPAENASKFGFKLPADYNSACVLEWSKNSPDMTTIAFVDEYGIVRVMRGGKVIAQTEPRAGGSLDCWKSPASGNMYMVSSTLSDTKDAVLLLTLKKKAKEYAIEKQWASAQFDGAVTRVRFSDLDRNGVPEVVGILEKPAGSPPRMFYAAPQFPKEDRP